MPDDASVVNRFCDGCLQTVNSNISCPGCGGNNFRTIDMTLGEEIDPEKAIRESGLHLQFPD